MDKISSNSNINNFFKNTKEVKVYSCGSKKENKLTNRLKKLLTSTALVSAVAFSTVFISNNAQGQIFNFQKEYKHITLENNDVNAVKDNLKSLPSMLTEGRQIAASEIAKAFLKKDGSIPSSREMKEHLKTITKVNLSASDEEVIALSKFAAAHIEKKGTMPTEKTLRYYGEKLRETENRWGKCNVVAVAELASSRMKRDKNFEFPRSNIILQDVNFLKYGVPANGASADDYIVAANLVSAYIEKTGGRPKNRDLQDYVKRLEIAAPKIQDRGSVRGLSEIAKAHIINKGSMPSVEDMEYEMALIKAVVGNTNRLGVVVAASNIRFANLLNDNQKQKTASFVIESAKMNMAKNSRS